MKKISRLLVFLLFVSSSVSAQKVYFIYLQTENQQPFYVRIGEKVYNSSAAGYIILSNLRDSTYSVNIGIQGSQTPDLPYTLTVNKKDQGYLIKNFGEKGWGLFNLTTMVVSMPVSNVTTQVQTVKTEKRESNPFTDLLAKAADDSTIKEKPIIERTEERKVEPPIAVIEKKAEEKAEIKQNNPPKQEEINKVIDVVEKKQEPKMDSMANKVQDPDTSRAKSVNVPTPVTNQKEGRELVKLDTVKKENTSETKDIQQEPVAEVYKKSIVRLKSESSTTVGIGLVFLDNFSDDKVDTIRILIPAETRKAIPVEAKQDEKKFLDITPADSVKSETIQTPEVKTKRCDQEATNDDFFKLRKNMASETSDDNMIAEAVKTFKLKCYSTQQVKNLSTLFLTDEFKYKFFDAAYPYISDADKFSALQSELKDAYYINRFKAMLRQ